MHMLWMWCSTDNLEQFVEHLLIGKLDPYIKSAPQPQTDDGLIKVNRFYGCFTFWSLLLISLNCTHFVFSLTLNVHGFCLKNLFCSCFATQLILVAFESECLEIIATSRTTLPLIRYVLLFFAKGRSKFEILLV